MSSLKELLKSIDVKNTDWEKFDWNTFESHLKNYQETGATNLSHDEVVKLSVIRGFQAVYGKRREPRRTPF
ncbi:hypothetical protein L6258_03740, partial [Candidatus Parcubacteria bacterium]|nr:hypothetical protein [Candidatus Parcubacteria bacterium]